MRKKTRKILFYSFSALFLILSGYILMTAQGWVIDAKNMELVKTGALFLNFSPSDVTLTINDKPRRVSSSVFQSGTLIRNLAPGNYIVKLSKPGYQNWEKKLAVTSGLVTGASQIKLWPSNKAYELLTTETIKDLWLTSKGIIYQNSDDTITFDQITLRGESVAHADNRSKLLITSEQQNYFLIDLDNPSVAINLNHLFNSLKQRQLLLPGIVPIQQIFIHPFSPHKLLITSLTSLYSLDLRKFHLEKLVTVDVITTVYLSNNEAFIINQDNGSSTLSIVNLLLKTTSQYPLNITSVSNIRVNPKGTKIFILDTKGNLTLFNRSSQTLKLLAENVKDFRLSPEEKRIALVTHDNTLTIFYLDNYYSDEKHLSGTMSEIPLADNKEIKSFSWIPKLLNHFLVLLEQDLVVSELDLRPPINSHILFTEVEKYVLENKNLYVLKKNGELIKVDLGSLN